MPASDAMTRLALSNELVTGSDCCQTSTDLLNVMDTNIGVYKIPVDCVDKPAAYKRERVHVNSASRELQAQASQHQCISSSTCAYNTLSTKLHTVNSQSCDSHVMWPACSTNFISVGLKVTLGYTAQHLILFINPNQKRSTSHLSGKYTNHAEL